MLSGVEIISVVSFHKITLIVYIQCLIPSNPKILLFGIKFRDIVQPERGITDPSHTGRFISVKSMVRVHSHPPIYPPQVEGGGYVFGLHPCTSLRTPEWGYTHMSILMAQKCGAMWISLCRSWASTICGKKG